MSHHSEVVLAAFAQFLVNFLSLAHLPIIWGLLFKVDQIGDLTVKLCRRCAALILRALRRVYRDAESVRLGPFEIRLRGRPKRRRPPGQARPGTA